MHGAYLLTGIKAPCGERAMLCAPRARLRKARRRSMQVGFIGLGHMGQPLALRLLKAGHHVTVYNRTRARAEALAALGAAVAHTVADATSRAEVVITMLADDAAVEGVVFGNDGILSALPR